jgi:hypothetical protein
MSDENKPPVTTPDVLPHTVDNPDKYPSGFVVTPDAGIKWTNDSGYSKIEIQFAGTSPISQDGKAPINNLTIDEGSPRLTHVIGKEGVYPYVVHYHVDEGNDSKCKCKWKGMHFLSVSHCLGCLGG